MTREPRPTVIVVALMLLSIVMLFAIAGETRLARADEHPADLLHYSFATWLGGDATAYKVGDQRAYVFRAPLSYMLRDSEDGKIGLKLLLPVSFAVQNQSRSTTDFAAAAFVPGLEAQIPVTKYWTLKPLVQFGAGKDTDGGGIQYIYGVGAKSLVTTSWRDFVFGIGNSLIWGEDRDASVDGASDLVLLEAGLDIRHPLGRTLWDRNLDASIFFVISNYLNGLDFVEETGVIERVKTAYNMGLTFGFDEPISICTIEVDRVGIDYRWGGRFRGVGINVGFPF